jgi:hypothetical protein
MKVRVLYRQGKIKPGVWNLSDKFARKLLREGKAVEAKEEKTALNTKEEKFNRSILTKTAISKLNVTKLSNADLEYILKHDTRITARKMARKEIESR